MKEIEYLMQQFRYWLSYERDFRCVIAKDTIKCRIKTYARFHKQYNKYFKLLRKMKMNYLKLLRTSSRRSVQWLIYKVEYWNDRKSNRTYICWYEKINDVLSRKLWLDIEYQKHKYYDINSDHMFLFTWFSIYLIFYWR